MSVSGKRTRSPASPRSRGSRPSSQRAALRRLADQVLETPDPARLALLLTRRLPSAAGVDGVTLLLWDRRLDTFESLSPGETQIHAVRPGGTAAPEARYLISEGTVLEMPDHPGSGALLPLMARSGLVGMLVLGARRARRKPSYSPAEARLLSVLAARCALALENDLYQKELIASERVAALGTMAGMMAHDFRGPMTVIRGYAETFLTPGSTEEEIQARARTMIEMVDRLERMTTETLDFARGSVKVARRTVNLQSVLEELAAGIEEELPGLDVARDFGVPLATTASLDVDKLRRAASNIAANARDAMGGKGRLLLTARLLEPAEERFAGALVLTLEDEGPGVPPEIRESLFEPFVTRGKKGGTGLGLAVARRFVEDHGGKLDLLPEGPGARFRLTLPVADAPPT